MLAKHILNAVKELIGYHRDKLMGMSPVLFLMKIWPQTQRRLYRPKGLLYPGEHGHSPAVSACRLNRSGRFSAYNSRQIGPFQRIADFFPESNGSTVTTARLGMLKKL
jgi:hypothetical protein